MKMHLDSLTDYFSSLDLLLSEKYTLYPIKSRQVKESPSS